MKAQLHFYTPAVGPLLLLALAGCTSPQSANLAGASTKAIAGPGPHNLIVVVKTNPSELNADWPPLPATQTIKLPSTLEEYKNYRLPDGNYEALEKTVEPGETGKNSGPHNIILVTMAKGKLRGTPLAKPPHVFVHVGSKSHEPGDTYGERPAPFAVIYVPEDFGQETAAH